MEHEHRREEDKLSNRAKTFIAWLSPIISVAVIFIGLYVIPPKDAAAAVDRRLDTLEQFKGKIEQQVTDFIKADDTRWEYVKDVIDKLYNIHLKGDAQ